MSGLFAINKPSGISSAGLLNDLQNILKKSPLFEPEIKAQQERSESGNKGRKSRHNNKIKMGHGGTLDPLASGVLVVGTGRGTKELGKFLSCSKDYEAIALFGCSTDTYDSEGKVVHRRPWQHITPEKIEDTLAQFRGHIMQTPPIYSALKMQGKPLYEYAREGKPLPAEIKARPAHVTKFAITKFTHQHDWEIPTEEAPDEIKLSADALAQLQTSGREAATNDERIANLERPTPNQADQAKSGDDKQTLSSTVEVPQASLEGAEPPSKKLKTEVSDLTTAQVDTTSQKPLALHISMTVSSGTYVRSLIHDLGLALGSAAHMVALERRRVGEYKLEDAMEWRTFESGGWVEPLKKRLQFLDQAVVSSSGKTSDDLDATGNVVAALAPENALEEPVHEFLDACLPFKRTLTYAQSLDGKISGPNSKPLIISCPESFRVTHELRRRHDLILVGVGTALNDDPGLNARNHLGMPYALGEQPIPVILDPRGRLALGAESKLMKNVRRRMGKQPLQLVLKDHCEGLQTKATVVPLIDTRENPYETESMLKWTDIFQTIAAFGESVMVEGGATVIKGILQQEAADQVIITVAPTYVGPGVSIELDLRVPLVSVRTRCFGRDSVIVGKMKCHAV